MRDNMYPTVPPRDGFQRVLALAVLMLFVAVCLGRLFAPEMALFHELMPVVSGFLAVVVRYYFVGRERA
jgi:hypothetical protein